MSHPSLAGTDAGTLDGGGPGHTVPAGCRPNADGVITRDEMPAAPGLHANYLRSTRTHFDAGGVELADGGLAWDFTQTLSGDRSVRVETLPIAGAWFAAHFPDAGYAAPLGQGSDLLGVFRLDSDALLLLGAVSPQEGYTFLIYNPPVTVLKLPMKLGDSWKSRGTVSGQFQGQALTWVPLQTDFYTSTVDLAGRAVTPYASFPVLRVATVMERYRGFFPSPLETQRSYAYVTECFGNVATLTSAAGEQAREPTTFNEVSRLTP